jgi:hypothetical protein
MGRLIDVQQGQALPARLTLRVGDLLMFSATGGRVQSGADVIELLGHFLPGVLADNDDILSPAGPPSTVFFLARRPGRATIDVVTGDPWHAPQTTTLMLNVEP